MNHLGLDPLQLCCVVSCVMIVSNWEKSICTLDFDKDRKWIKKLDVANRVVFNEFLFRNPKLIVLFFCDTSYFWCRTIFFRLFHLWRAITPSRKLPRPINYTFLDSSGRQLSHGTLDIWTYIKISSNLPKSKKKSVFCIFWCPHPKQIHVAADRTMLTPAAFLIAHLKADVLRISKMW